VIEAFPNTRRTDLGVTDVVDASTPLEREKHLGNLIDFVE
jgi:hypothetical protein